MQVLRGIRPAPAYDVVGMSENKIDFLGIGAQKAATSWLYENLQRHPDIWLPPIKELHYFDRSPHYPSPSHLSTDHLLHRLLGRERFNKQFRKNLHGDLKASISAKDWQTVAWLLHYYLGTYGDHWYFSLFRPADGKLKGEITPSYSILDLRDVAHIRGIVPDLKIIMILRNPIERAWSHLRFISMLGMFKDINDLDKARQFIDSDDQSLRGDYVRTLDIWHACFPEEQIYIGFFEDVQRDPGKLITDIYNFLGVHSRFAVDRMKVKTKVNAAKSVNMPAEISYYLAEKYHPMLKKLTAMVGGYSIAWLTMAEKILSRTQLF